MDDYSRGHDLPKLVVDPNFESGALFDVEAPAVEPERHLRIVPTLGAVATEKHAYSDARSAAAKDDTLEENPSPRGEPIIPQSPRRVVGGSVYVSVPGRVPVIRARRPQE